MQLSRRCARTSSCTARSSSAASRGATSVGRSSPTSPPTLEDLTLHRRARRGRHRRAALQGPASATASSRASTSSSSTSRASSRELTVFMRPMSALTAFNEQMAARLGVESQGLNTLESPLSPGGVSEWLKESAVNALALPTQVRILPPPYEQPRCRARPCAMRSPGLPAGWGRLSPSGSRRPARRSPGPTSPGTLDEVGAELGLPAERWDGRAVDLLDEEATRAWCAALLERFGRVDALLHLVGGWRGGSRCTRRRSTDWDAAPRPADPHRPAHHARLPRRAARQRAGPLRPRLRQAGAGSDQHQRRLRRGQGRRRGLDARLRRRLRRHVGGPPTSSSSTRSSPRACGGEPRRGFSHFHPGRAHRRGDRIPLLRRRREDERAAFAAYDARADEPSPPRAR